MAMPPPKVCRIIRRLLGLLGSANAQEVEAARQKIITLLAKHGLTWNDLHAVLREGDSAAAAPPHRLTDTPPPENDPDARPQYNVLNLVDGLIEKYEETTQEQRLAVALWALHSYIYDRYDITPRLALLSPVYGCGKTKLMTLLEALTPNSERIDNVTAAAIYRSLDTAQPPTLLLDEGDNLGLLNDRNLRAVMNSGHLRGGVFKRAVGRGQGVRRYYTFAPLAVAAIGTLPRPLMQRCITINMQRRSPSLPALPWPTGPGFQLIRNHLRAEIQKWANTCNLNPDPEVPLKNRAADNWRVLLAIADDLGRGDEARKAALALSGGLPDEDPKVLLLIDIRDVFNATSVDRISSAILLEKLHAIEMGMWMEWRGPNDDQQPHKLTANELARAVRSFGIHPRTVWQLGPRH
jgi:hypothetical protein